ncbi:MAG: L,D-transpeptidase family protein [Anaerolineae bacterium]|nr:L,D-transpeptidase family protein [Anaerolineae bacterium]
MRKHQILLAIIGCILVIPTISASENCPPNANTIPCESGYVFSEPNVTPLTPNQTLMYDRWYHQVTQRAEVLDAPGGTAVRVIEPGFNFVTILSDTDGWAQINQGEYVSSEFLTDTSWIVSSFTGVLLPPEGLEYTMAWVLVNLYPSSTPGEEPLESNGLIYRYTRVNIYDTATINGEDWFMIGDGQWVHQYHVARILPIQRPETIDTNLWVSIDLYEQVLIAYQGETPVFSTLVSTGLPRWPTREGTWHIYYRNPREYMSWGTVGDDFYSLEEVPWTMFFDEGRALHGAYWHDGFGYRRSHGCVNLSITDAKWLYDWVAADMGSTRSADVEEGPAVFVYSSGEYTE